MNFATRLLLLLLLLLLAVCGPGAHGGEPKEVVKVVPDLGNTGIQESVHSALLELDKEMVALDTKFRDVSMTWAADVASAKTTFDMHLVFAYMEMDELSDEDDGRRIAKLVDNWRNILIGFTDDKILKAGAVAMELSDQLGQDWADLVDFHETESYTTDGFVEWGIKIQDGFRKLEDEVADMKAMSPGLKRLEKKSDLKKRVGDLATRLGNLGSAARGRATDAEAFLKKADPKARQTEYEELIEKTWESGNLRSYSQWVPAAWFTMIDEWVVVMRERYGKCVVAHGDAHTACLPLMEGKLFSGVRFIAGLSYEELATPLQKLKKELE